MSQHQINKVTQTFCRLLCHHPCNWTVNSPILWNGSSCLKIHHRSVLVTALVTLAKGGFIAEESHSSLSKVGKNPIDTAYDGVSGRGLNGRRLLLPALASHLRKLSLDITGCLEGGIKRRTNTGDIFDEDNRSYNCALITCICVPGMP
ncbi:hypothetical protein TNCV_2414981 [Trichonephila clavipes]|nr:hypothetical protein TNCV_2414981 [Trichonephila clavipes]